MRLVPREGRGALEEHARDERRHPHLDRHRREQHASEVRVRDPRSAAHAAGHPVREGVLPAAAARRRGAAGDRRRPRDRARGAADPEPVLPGALRSRAAALGRAGRPPRAPRADPLLHGLRRRDGPADRHAAARGTRRDRAGRYEAAHPPQSEPPRALEDELRDPPGGAPSRRRGARRAALGGGELEPQAHHRAGREASPRAARHRRERASAHLHRAVLPRGARALRVLRTRTETGAWRATVDRVGLVPTMGALHAGHLSLVERAARDMDATVVSIFVNPTQFGPSEDFTKYPRQEAADIAMLEHAGITAAFVPSVNEMYPKGDRMRVDPGAIAAPLEGAARPGHFVGVATVVARLFEIVRPNIAYFGQKDFQQLRVLQTVAAERYPSIRVIGCPTVRESDGLAMSSRNAYLDPDERRSALALSRGLFAAQQAWSRGTRDPGRLRSQVLDVIEKEPRVDLE